MNVIVTITGRQTLDGQSDVTRVTAKGHLFPREDGWELHYRQDEGGQTVFTKVEITDGRMKIERRGDTRSTLILQAGKRHESDYHTPHGILRMGLETHSLSSSLTPGGGRVEAEYTLNINETVTAQHTLSIEVKGADRECQK